MRREGYTGEGAFSKRLPCADFFGYFLVRYKKVTFPHKQRARRTHSQQALIILYSFPSSFSSAESFKLMVSASMAFSSSSTGGRLGAIRRLLSLGSLR